ncbi:type II toxin-antitoxin system PemK/MazF family toxin [Sphingobacterium spiritivorum]|uniref:type II toxin-antitoxin system PemK/MazF family toxin n=1 Tax=Sphingobacterium spiritivorum TaxID=258 RepID=UPI003DA3BF23
MAYNIGDVVLVHFPYKEDPQKTKPRPAVIINKNSIPIFVLVQITSTNRSDKLKGKWIPKDSAYGKSMGLLCDSFVNYENIVKLNSMYIIRKIGDCPFTDEILLKKAV